MWILLYKQYHSCIEGTIHSDTLSKEFYKQTTDSTVYIGLELVYEGPVHVLD